MLNNFDVLLSQQIQQEVQRQIAEIKPKETIVKETIIKENLEDSLKCYSVEEVARNFLHIETVSVRKLIEAGELKAIKFKGLKIPASELLRFLQENAGRDFTDILKS